MLRRLHFELRYLLNNTPWDSGVTPPELLRFLADHPAGRAIDLGCGTGTNVITLAEHGWQAVGIDVSRKAIMTARRKARRAQVKATFVRGSVLSMNGRPAIAGSYDLALDIGCLHSLETGERPHYEQRVASLVSPGGTYLLYTFLRPPAAESDRWPPEAEIRGLLERDFRLQLVEHGTFHGRDSAWFTFERRG